MKVLKNTTASEIDLKYLATTIPASTNRAVNVEDYIRLASDDSVAELTPLINSGDIVVNDGTNDLSVSDALAFIEYADYAPNIRFNNSTNGFAAKNVQEAIEEAIIPPQFCLTKDTLNNGEVLLINNNYQLIIADVFYNYGTIRNLGRFKVV